MYNIRSIKQVIFYKYATNMKMTISHRSNLRFAPVITFYLNFAFLIDIIDNINMYSLYSPYYAPRTSTNGSAVYWSCDTDGDM